MMDDRSAVATASLATMPAPVRPTLLLAYDFPPLGGGISRWMGELTRRYPPGSLVVSTGAHVGSEEVDAAFPQRIDRVSVPARRLRTVQGLLMWSRRVAVLARTLEPGFIWCANVKPAAYPAKWALERLGTPYGVIVHGTDLLGIRHQINQSAVKRNVARLLLGSASVIVANSRWTRSLCLSVLNELGFAAGEHEVRTVPLGTDPNHFRPGLDTAAVREKYGLGHGRWIVTVARLVGHKGIDTTLRVLAALKDSEPDLGYAVIGSGRDHAELCLAASRLGVVDRVRFLRGVPDADLPALLNVAEAYVGVSRVVDTMVEGFGIALTEASACGIPVVAGRSGGMPDAVRDGETGILVDGENVEAVTEAVRTLLHDRALAKRLGAGGRKAVETYYNWDRVTADLMALGAEFGRTAR